MIPISIDYKSSVVLELNSMAKKVGNNLQIHHFVPSLDSPLLVDHLQVKSHQHFNSTASAATADPNARWISKFIPRKRLKRYQQWQIQMGSHCSYVLPHSRLMQLNRLTSRNNQLKHLFWELQWSPLLVKITVQLNHLSQLTLGLAQFT